MMGLSEIIHSRVAMITSEMITSEMITSDQLGDDGTCPHHPSPLLR